MEKLEYSPGQVMEGKVVDITKFGAFVKLPGGKTGLVHISQISEDYVKEVADYLTVGKPVFVKIAAIDDKGRIQLSMKGITEDAIKVAVKQEEKKPWTGREEHHREPRIREGREGPYEDSFERKLRNFMRQSEDRLVDIKRNIDAKRGIKKKKRQTTR
ncbi:MAG: S1 RNA-binding domain-containing protein [bacterium]